MPRPVEAITTQPLGLIDLLDGSFAALRQRARVLVTVVAGLVVPVSLLQAFLARGTLGGVGLTQMLNDPTVAQETPGLGAVYGPAWLVGQLLHLLVVAVGGAAVSLVIGGWIDGTDLQARAVGRLIVGRLPALLGAFALVHLLQAVGFVLLAVPGLVAVVLCSLTSPVLALERLGPVAAIRRSAQLVRRRPGTVLGVIGLLGLVDYGVGQAVGTLPNGVALVIGTGRAWPLQAAAAAASALILVPVTGAAMCLTYLDIRFRTEGLDLSWRMAAAFRSSSLPLVPVVPGEPAGAPAGSAVHPGPPGFGVGR